jgi:D-tyrosyl-tRNA(Tyr) deacylase
MRAVIQRVNRASVAIADKHEVQIGPGLLVLLGIEKDDTNEDGIWLSKKITQLRIFNDHSGVMNINIQDIRGDIMVVSQFTLHAKTKKGNRPSYVAAAKPEQAIPLYESFIQMLSNQIGKPVVTGEFGAMMQIALVNDGPVTIIIDTKNKE